MVTKITEYDELFLPKWRGVFVLGISILFVLSGFFIDNVLSYLMLLFIIPVFYGTHEAIHNTLIPKVGLSNRTHKLLNEIALVVGFILQGMNYQIVYQSHLFHHKYGRYEGGYAPDIVLGPPKVKDYIIYYSTILGYPALIWQIAGFALLIIKPHKLPFLNEVSINSKKFRFKFVHAQILIILFFSVAIYFGGITKFLIYEACFLLVWSLLQNVSHYGLCGIDPETDRVCSRSYILGEPFKTLTFGSTSHLAHHVFMNIPGSSLANQKVIESVQNSLGVTVEVKYGMFSFLKDVLQQFKGPIYEKNLNTSWIKGIKDRRFVHDKSPIGFEYRSGRKWEDELKH